MVLLNSVNQWPVLTRVVMLQREYFWIEMLGNLPFPHKLAILHFSDSVGISLAIWSFL